MFRPSGRATRARHRKLMWLAQWPFISRRHSGLHATRRSNFHRDPLAIMNVISADDHSTYQRAYRRRGRCLLRSHRSLRTSASAAPLCSTSCCSTTSISGPSPGLKNPAIPPLAFACAAADRLAAFGVHARLSSEHTAVTTTNGSTPASRRNGCGLGLGGLEERHALDCRSALHF